MFKIRDKILVTYLSVVIIPIIIISVFFVFYTAESLKRDKIKSFKQATKTKVENAEDFIRSVKNDIVSLSNCIFLLNLIDAKKNKDIEQVYRCKFELNNLFKTLSESRSIYDQIRYIDEFGHEVVRVNLLHSDDVRIIPPEELQSKSHRYYFEEAVRLNEGEIYGNYIFDFAK